MKILITRRTVLRNVATAGAGALFAPIAAAQDKPIQIAGKPVEVTLTAVTPHTVRIAIQPLENGLPRPIPRDGALVREDFGKPQAKLRALAASRDVKCGNLTVKLTGDPFAIRVEGEGGRLLQDLRFDATGKMTFL